jgi:hypothetical protein
MMKGQQRAVGTCRAKSRIFPLAVMVAVVAMALYAFYFNVCATTQFSGYYYVDNGNETPITKQSTTTFDNANNDYHGGYSHQLVPNKCDSQIRGQFDDIYKRGVWGQVQLKPEDFYGEAEWPPKAIRQMSASGRGSDLGYATQNSLAIVKQTIYNYNVKSMIDVPCGDVNWIFDSFLTDSLPLYVGLDIAGDVIGINQRRFAHHRNKQFHFWDVTSCALPKFHNTSSSEEQVFDLIHVRDVIQHMSLDQGIQFFCNVFKAGPNVLITTSYPSSKNNNIAEGRWYGNNLLLEPFTFPHVNCTPSHIGLEMEHDVTCVYNLTEDWVQEFMKSKCKV